MTHSLHRQGSVESLRGDYVFLCTPAKGVNNKDAAGKLLRVLDILLEIGPANIGFYGHGNMISGINIEAVKQTLHDNSRLRCCFDDKAKLMEALRRIKSENLGLSITISGLISELKGLCKELSLEPHTVNLSCGIFGKTDRLPNRQILEISTMCGHGMISHRLAEDVIDKLRKGSIDIDAAVRQLGAPCTCGIFNPSRTREILETILE